MNLFIDTHYKDIVIILEKNETIIKEKILRNEKENNKFIMPLIKEVLNNITPESIIVVNGPGSFTGVRLGVTIAKALAYTLEIPIRTITFLEMMAVCLEDDNKIVGFKDNNGYYIGKFGKNNNLIDDYEYLSFSKYDKYLEKEIIKTNIDIDYIKVIKYAMLKETINAHKVNPIYIKKISVEENV